MGATDEGRKETGRNGGGRREIMAGLGRREEFCKREERINKLKHRNAGFSKQRNFSVKK